MTKKNVIVPKNLRMGGGFDVSERELAQWELEQTQRRLGGVRVPPAGSREEAEMKLNSTLSGKTSKAPTNDVEKEIVEMKLAEAPSSKRAAILALRRTQRALGKSRLRK